MIKYTARISLMLFDEQSKREYSLQRILDPLSSEAVVDHWLAEIKRLIMNGPEPPFPPEPPESRRPYSRILLREAEVCQECAHLFLSINRLRSCGDHEGLDEV